MIQARNILIPHKLTLDLEKEIEVIMECLDALEENATTFEIADVLMQKFSTPQQLHDSIISMRFIISKN